MASNKSAEKNEPQAAPEGTLIVKDEPTAQPFQCPNDRCTKFHKHEFGELVSGGVFVVRDVTFRCVVCQTEYTTVHGEVVKV